MKRLLVLSLLAVGALAPVAGTAAAAVRDRGVADFNGDGFGDLAVGSLDASRNQAGSVFVFYGTAKGLTTHGVQVWTQDSPGVPGVGEGQDYFGSSLANGDFDGDGFDDLAIGAPRESVEGHESAGMVHVLYGSTRGLATARTQYFHQSTPGVHGSPSRLAEFGRSLAAGDFDGDGRDELAIGAQRIWVLRGSTTGLRPGVVLDPPGAATVVRVLVTGDFDGDGADDLAAGDLVSPYRGGAVGVVYGVHGRGIATTEWAVFHQGSPNVIGIDEIGDQFGSALAAADLNLDGRDDLVVGSPGEDVDEDTARDGAVHILRGSSNGLTAVGSGSYHQDVSGVPGVAAGGGFGWAVAAGDADHDGIPDIAIGAPWDPLGREFARGTVTVLYGGTTARTQRWHEDVAGVPGIADGDHFGSVLTFGDVNGDDHADLVGGLQSEAVRSQTEAGAFFLMPGRSTGVATNGALLWHLDTPGVPGVPRAASFLGIAVAA